MILCLELAVATSVERLSDAKAINQTLLNPEGLLFGVEAQERWSKISCHASWDRAKERHPSPSPRKTHTYDSNLRVLR